MCWGLNVCRDEFDRDGLGGCCGAGERQERRERRWDGGHCECSVCGYGGWKEKEAGGWVGTMEDTWK